MESHEIRLINERGETSLVYLAQCASDEHAKETLARVEAPFARFEIWRGLQKVAEGEREALRRG
jgi:hypothetical protein